MKKLTPAAFLLLFAMGAHGNPIIVSIDPDSAKRDRRLEVTIIGQDTHFRAQDEYNTLSATLWNGEVQITGSNNHRVSNTEMNSTFYVPTTADLGSWDLTVYATEDGSMRLDDCFTVLPHTLRLVPGEYAGINAAADSASSGDTVLVEPGTYQERINFRGEDIVIASQYILTGDRNDITNTILDGQGEGNIITFAQNETRAAVLNGFCLTGGWASIGGGIYCSSDSRPTIENCIIRDNASGGLGGAIACRRGSEPLLNRCLIIHNAARMGGAVSSSGASRPLLLNCTIADNSAGEGGAAIYCWSGGKAVLANSIIWHNPSPAVFFSDQNEANEIAVFYSDLEGGEDGIETNNNGAALWLEGNMDSDPRFADWELDDYNLLPYSPVIDTGALFVVVGEDTLAALGDGDYLGQAPDLGALEADPRRADSIGEPYPWGFELSAPHPNPFNSATRLECRIPTGAWINFSLFDYQGRLVRNFGAGVYQPGEHIITVNAAGLSGGLYLLQMTAGEVSLQKRLVLLK